MSSIFVPKEHAASETRVAATPETVKRLVKLGHTVAIEAGAAATAHIGDPAYEQAGARVVAAAAVREAWSTADVVAKVGPPLPSAALGGAHEASALKPGALLVGLLAPHTNLEAVRELMQRGASALAMELIPRISRAQTMDALSSQASIAGYKAVLLAADRLDKYFPLMMSAAGTVQPAKVVILGAGVAGLQALATARRLGAVVHVSDIRPAVKEEVQSLGGRFIDLPQLGESGEGQGGYAKEVSADFLRRQREVVDAQLVAADVVITTALVPGKPAPKLVSAAVVERMRPGAVIVDLAVAQGGNCELSVAGAEVERHGVRIVGPANLAAELPADASALYARNVSALLSHLTRREEGGGAIALDLDDEIVAGALLLHDGALRHAETQAALGESERAARPVAAPQPTTGGDR